MSPSASPGDDPDFELIRRFVEGEDRGLDQLVKRHGRAVYSFIYRLLGNDPSVDDLYQDVWLRVVRGLAKFGRRSRFTTWLFQITRNICIDHLRKRQRQGRALSIDEPSGPNGNDEEPYRHLLKSRDKPIPEALEYQEIIRHVEAAVAQLPIEQKEVFLLRQSTELTFEEISQMSGVPRNTVKSRMRYALENIRKFLSTRNIGIEVTHND